MAKQGEENRRICPNCHVGYVRHQHLAHVVWDDGQPIVMPNVQAEVCDYCGETSFDDDQLWRLDQLLRHGTDLHAFPPKPHGRTIM